MKDKIAFIGAGNMGGAIVEGMISSGAIAASQFSVCDKSQTIRDKFTSLGVAVYNDAISAVAGADIVVIAVKPYLVEMVAREIKSLVADKTIVSIAAGVDCETLKEYFSKECFRVIPNIAASYSESMTFISSNSLDATKPIEMFSMVGEAEVIDEKLLDAAMVSASCGTAYALRYIRAAMEASIEMGLTAGLSRKVVAQTVLGACKILLESDLHPEQAVDMVTTPGGITIVGLNEMERKGFSSAVISAHQAAYKRVKNK